MYASVAKQPADRDDFVELTEAFLLIVQQFQRLELADLFGLYGHLLDGKMGILAEHKAIRDSYALVRPEDGFMGTSKWHTDSTPDSYREYWDRALQSVRGAAKNPRAVALVIESAENLKNSAIIARASMTEYQSTGTWGPQLRARYDLLLPILAEKEAEVDTILVQAQAVRTSTET